MTPEYEPRIRAAVDALDLDALTAEFHDQGEFIFLPALLPASLVAEMVAQYRRFTPRDVHRVRLPWLRKAGTIDQRTIARTAPLLDALHRSPSLLALTSRLSGQPLAFKHDRDAHAAALYVYQRAGDHIGFHYDACGCEAQASYTGTFGVINDTAARVHFQLCKDDPARMRERYVAMTPGSFVFFCGSKAYHRVTPLATGDERVAYSFAYVREGKRLRGVKRFTENLKDAILYFGPKAIFQNNYR